jgi:acetyl-CoA carboxylase biotin carboxyl carrier protein
VAKSTAGSSKKRNSSRKNGSEDLQQLEKIFELMEKHEVTELEWDRGPERLKVKTRHASADLALRSALASSELSSFRTFQETSAKTEVVKSAPTSTPESDSASSVSKSVVAPSNQKQVVSPFVGTFYRSSSPDSDPYVREGQVVKRGDVLCIIEAMKLMNEIDAEFPGKIISVLVENGQPVEFGEPLFIIEP